MLAPYVFVSTWLVLTADRLRTRAARDERGQTAAEYLGILVVIVAIIGAIVGTGIGADIFNEIKNAIKDIAGGGKKG